MIPAITFDKPNSSLSAITFDKPNSYKGTKKVSYYITSIFFDTLNLPSIVHILESAFHDLSFC